MGKDRSDIPQKTVNDFARRIKGFYESFDRDTIANLEELYDTDAVFIDPLRPLHGVDEIRQHFDRLGKDLIECRFEFTDSILGANELQLIWRMHYAHPALAKGKQLSLRGTSFIKLNADNGKIIYHEDFYDVGAMLYQHVPLFGQVVRWLNKRLSN